MQFCYRSGGGKLHWVLPSSVTPFWFKCQSIQGGYNWLAFLDHLQLCSLCLWPSQRDLAVHAGQYTNRAIHD
jgi:hypothetical protein